jgi:hypothetical protein
MTRGSTSSTYRDFVFHEVEGSLTSLLPMSDSPISPWANQWSILLSWSMDTIKSQTRVHESLRLCPLTFSSCKSSKWWSLTTCPLNAMTQILFQDFGSPCSRVLNSQTENLLHLFLEYEICWQVSRHRSMTHIPSVVHGPGISSLILTPCGPMISKGSHLINQTTEIWPRHSDPFSFENLKFQVALPSELPTTDEYDSS